MTCQTLLQSFYYSNIESDAPLNILKKIFWILRWCVFNWPTKNSLNLITNVYNDTFFNQTIQNVIQHNMII